MAPDSGQHRLFGRRGSPPKFTAPGEQARKTGQMLLHPKAHRATNLTNESLQVSYEDLFLYVSAFTSIPPFFSPAFLLCLLKSSTHTPLPRIRKGFREEAARILPAPWSSATAWTCKCLRPRGFCSGHSGIARRGAREDWALHTNIRTLRCFFLRLPHCPTLARLHLSPPELTLTK